MQFLAMVFILGSSPCAPPLSPNRSPKDLYLTDLSRCFQQLVKLYRSQAQALEKLGSQTGDLEGGSHTLPELKALGRGYGCRSSGGGERARLAWWELVHEEGSLGSG